MIRWLKRPAMRGQVLTNAIVILVLALWLSHHLATRQNIRDAQVRRTNQGICLALSLVPPQVVPVQDRATVATVRADLNCD
jgi:hypothetical protein